MSSAPLATAALPVIAAFSGMIVPAAFYAITASAGGGSLDGWAVPMATGSARREWAFVTDRVALTGGALTAVVVGALGWTYGEYGAVAWALLVGLLVAQVMGRRAER